MGLLEYKANAMPSLRDVAHDVWLCTYNNSWKFHQLAAGPLLPGQPVRYEKGRWYGPSINTKSHLPGHFPPASQAGRCVGQAL